MTPIPLPRRAPWLAVAGLSAWSLCCPALAPGAPGAGEPSTRPPNVVIFLADDAGWGDYGHSGNRLARTPHIDSLARDGVSLARFCVQPVCAPTRAEFLTGRYHPRGGVRGVSTGHERLDLTERTVAEAFQAAGYATGLFGKWHNGSQWPYHPRARGFDEFLGYTSGHWGEYFDPPLENSQGRFERARGYIVDVCTDRALDFIERHRDHRFFCFVPFTTPHSPWAVPEQSWQRFRELPLEQPASVPAQEVADHTRCALAMMQNQDDNVGRVLARLDALGLRDRTVVLYFSDNGPNSARWNGGMKGRKGSTDEGGVRSVCFWRWPGRLPAGRAVPQIAGAIDLMPTLCALAGVPRAGTLPLDGRDLSPLLLGRETDWPERTLFSAWGGKVSARTQTHRLDERGQLFDLAADPGQSQPVNAREPALAARLAEAVAAWRREMFGASAAGGAPAMLDRVVDERPLPVGYREFPVTHLPARDGRPCGGVRRSSGAPNSSYFVNWRSREDRLVWRVAVATAGRYRVDVDYTCPLPDAGSTVELSFLEDRLSGKVAPGWDPPLYVNQDTLPRPEGESRMKEFHTLRLGELRLPTGEGELALRALDIPGETVMDLRRLTLTLLD